MPVRLKDIAEKANVSTQLASHVLNGTRTTSGVSDETRQRILQIAGELNYVRNAAASTLKRGRSMTVGLMSHWLPQAHYARPMMLAEDLCTAHGYALQVSRTRHAPRWVDLLRSGRVDLLLVTGLGELQLAGLDVPEGLQEKIVVFGGTTGETASHVRRQWGLQVTWDAGEISRLAANFLLERGCRAPAMLAGLHGAPNLAPSFSDLLQEHGITPALIRASQDHDLAAAGREMMHQVLDEHPGTDGIFLYSDETYPGVATALLERRPERLPELVGFGGYFPACLPSIHAPLAEAFRLVLEAFFDNRLSSLGDTQLQPVLLRE